VQNLNVKITTKLANLPQKFDNNNIFCTKYEIYYVYSATKFDKLCEVHATNDFIGITRTVTMTLLTTAIYLSDLLLKLNQMLRMSSSGLNTSTQMFPPFIDSFINDSLHLQPVPSIH